MNELRPDHLGARNEGGNVAWTNGADKIRSCTCISPELGYRYNPSQYVK